MDFDDTPQEAAFRAEVRDWLSKNAVKRSPHDKPRILPGTSSKELLMEARAWQKKKAQAGYAQITWPKAYGCREGHPIQQIIFDMEEMRYDVPLAFFKIGLGMCIPTMLAYATPEQKHRYVAPAVAGDEVWCQMFSEPSAGSDLAALRLRAKPDGGEWVLNGQKIWISGAQYSDYGIVLTKTNVDVPKHQGLTMFFVDMRTPGIEVRPIRHAGGHATFCEVFFNDARIADAQRLGGVNEGWKVALTTLMNERLNIAGSTNIPEFDVIHSFSKQVQIDGKPAIEHADIRGKLADWYVKEQGLRFTRYRLITAISKGEQPGPEASIAKLVNAGRQQEISSFALDLMETAGIINEEDVTPMNGAFHNAFFWTCGQRIAGGTDEILHNIIAERILGLPQEPRPDKASPSAKH